MKTRKNIALFLVFALLLTTGTISPFDSDNKGAKVVKAAEESDKFYNEDGDQAGNSEETPYQIGTAAHLRRLYDLVKSGAKNKNGKLYSECYYKLIQDITIIDGKVSISEDRQTAVFLGPDRTPLTEEELTEQKWNPILSFNGHFDGDGKSISGLYITETSFFEYNGMGLFDLLEADAVVQNLTINNSVIKITDENISTDNISFIAGISIKGTVNQCKEEADSCYIGQLSSGLSPTATATATAEPATATPTPTATAEPATATPTATPTAAPTATAEPATATPTAAPTATAEPVTTAPTTTVPTAAPSAKPTEPVGTIQTILPEPTAVVPVGKKVEVGGASYESVGNNEVSFSGADKVKKGTVTVPDTVTIDGVSCKVTTIGKKAFSGNKKIKKISLGNNVKTIGKGAFKNCTSLTSVKFPSGVKTVSDEAFYNCKKLKQVKLPGTLKTIGKATFKNCVSMKKFSVGAKTSSKKLYAAATTTPASKKISIGASAMENCIKLKQIVINAQVRRIGNAAFRQCKSLADIFVYSLKLQYVGKRALKGVSNCKISVPKKKMQPYTKLFRNKGQGKKVVMAKLA